MSKLFGRLVASLWAAGIVLAASGSLAGAEAPHAYVGTKQCRGCHQKEFQSWNPTKMAKAFDVLRPGTAGAAKQRAQLDPAKDYTKDARCLACHTTGYGKPGGFVDEKTTPDMAGVGCEACHGAGAGYAHQMKDKKAKKADFVATGMVSEVKAEECTGCHNTRTAAGTMIGSRHFVKQFTFSKTKGIHEKAAPK